MHGKSMIKETAHIFGGGGFPPTYHVGLYQMSAHVSHTFHRSVQYIYSSNAPRSHHAAFDFLPRSSSAPEWASDPVTLSVLFSRPHYCGWEVAGRFPPFYTTSPPPLSFESRSVIGSPLWQRDTHTRTIKVERGRISMSYTQRRGINYSSRTGEFLLYFPSLDMK